jgi:hypothetical protein
MSASLPKAQANLSALMNSVRMIDVQGRTLILGLASDVLVSKIDKPDQIEAIQKLIKDEFGADVSVRCVVTNAKGKIPRERGAGRHGGNRHPTRRRDCGYAGLVGRSPYRDHIT